MRKEGFPIESRLKIRGESIGSFCITNPTSAISANYLIELPVPLLSFRMRGERMRQLYLPLHLLLGSVVMACGLLEAWFGRPELFGDDISYLDVANMIRVGDWRAAFNPLWSIGYPLLLVLVRPFFPAGLHGEFTAVFALNITIYLATWLSFVWFLSTAADFIDTNLTPLVLTVAACVFVVVQIGFGKVSSVGPDQLVVCLFFLACGLLLRFSQQPTIANGMRLGTVLGVGFVVKAVFLPLSVIFITAALLPFRSRLPRKAALSVSGGVLLFLLPYAAGLSWAVGRPTLGESGQLNYAYHVNQLPHWMGWQGGPPRLGIPLHPVHLLRDHPAVFGFGEPFHVTYPPQFNLHFWYDGYNHCFSTLNAIRSITTNLHEFEKVLHENWPFTLPWRSPMHFWSTVARLPTNPAPCVGSAVSRCPSGLSTFPPSSASHSMYRCIWKAGTSPPSSPSSPLRPSSWWRRPAAKLQS